MIGYGIILGFSAVLVYLFVHHANKKVILAKSELAYVVKNTKNRIDKEIIARVLELDNHAKWLEEQTKIVLAYKKEADDIFEQGNNLAIWAREEIIKVQLYKDTAEKLMVDGKEAVKSNKTELFWLKEEALRLHGYYENVVSLLAMMINEEVNYEEIYNMLHTANANLSFLKNYFYKNFRQTPEQYTSQKISLEMRKQNGDTFISKFSKN